MTHRVQSGEDNGLSRSDLPTQLYAVHINHWSGLSDWIAVLSPECWLVPSVSANLVFIDSSTAVCHLLNALDLRPQAGSRRLLALTQLFIWRPCHARSWRWMLKWKLSYSFLSTSTSCLLEDSLVLFPLYRYIVVFYFPAGHRDSMVSRYPVLYHIIRVISFFLSDLSHHSSFLPNFSCHSIFLTFPTILSRPFQMLAPKRKSLPSSIPRPNKLRKQELSELSE